MKVKSACCLTFLAAALSAVAGGARAGGDDAAEEGDPFAYCAAVVTADRPGPPYDGPAVPPGVVEGLRRALNLAPDMPGDLIARGTRWRCMEGAVYGCFVGANLPCSEKADESRVPSPAMNDFCEENPGSEAIPMAVTGRATVYAWRCRDGGPEILRRVAEADPRGFIAKVWHRLAPPG